MLAQFAFLRSPGIALCETAGIGVSDLKAMLTRLRCRLDWYLDTLELA